MWMRRRRAASAQGRTHSRVCQVGCLYMGTYWQSAISVWGPYALGLSLPVSDWLHTVVI
jgi:hypothetical protein